MGYFSDDEDLDWAEWMKLTDEQADAIVHAEEKRYYEWFDSLTPLQRYRCSRGRALEGCLVWRKSHAQFGEGLSGFFMEQLRNRQKRLVKLRIELATGTYPGSA
jgi:hypothetical protein